MSEQLAFAEALEAAEQLDADAQVELVAVLSRRLAELEPELAARGSREARDPAAITDAARRVEAHAVERLMEPLKRKLDTDDIAREELQELRRLQALARELNRTS